MVTLAQVEEMALECRNWGRWGPEDELGTLNLVTTETTRAAASEIQGGQSYSLAIKFGASGPQITGQGGRFNPLHWMLASGADAAAEGRPNGYADDVLELPVHGATHWDCLGHVFHNGTMWNGYDMRLVGVRGASRCSIVPTRDKLVGRAVLLDIPRWKGVEWLSDGDSITPDDLDACLEAEEVRLRSGDFLLVRTGQMARCFEQGWGTFAGGDAPGLSLETALWLKQHDVAAVATDTWGAEVRPNAVPEMTQPWHRLAIPNAGLMVGEMFNLEALSEVSADDRRYTSLLVAPTLPIEGGVGSPVNPMAIR
ncbi:MAG TPA: cyclase family protein [Candidatus Nitrosotalea sp.]|nr:cyclase family protein [Candidatus Nitrosotalea sp.]